jgi:predicted transcriptional regulator
MSQGQAIQLMKQRGEQGLTATEMVELCKVAKTTANINLRKVLKCTQVTRTLIKKNGNREVYRYFWSENGRKNIIKRMDESI